MGRKSSGPKLAIIIPTKDRPDDICRMLASIADQTLLPTQVIVVDSTLESIEEHLRQFEHLNLTYQHFSPPSASRQRNAGISLLDEDIELVAFMDDDIVLEPVALQQIHQFWATPENDDVAGVALNVNDSGHPGVGWLKGSSLASWIGLYPEGEGQVAPSGWAFAHQHVDRNVYVEWLSSCAVVWKRDVLNYHQFEEFFDGYSYLEDLDFSYGVSRGSRLAIAADARYEHLHSQAGRTGMYKFGRIEIRNRLYFVKKHGLSLSRCCLAILVRMMLTLMEGIRNFQWSSFQRLGGNINGLVYSFASIHQWPSGSK